MDKIKEEEHCLRTKSGFAATLATDEIKNDFKTFRNGSPKRPLNISSIFNLSRGREMLQTKQRRSPAAIPRITSISRYIWCIE